MPIFEYTCSGCKDLFEAYVPSFRLAKEPRDCPQCKAPATYAGISQVRVGKEGYFGIITQDGQRHRGSLPRST